MPRKVCPICKNGYIHLEDQTKKFGRVVERIYKCDNGHHVRHNLETDTWEEIKVEEVE